MSIVKLTQNLENFKWTNYEKVGSTQSFIANGQTVTGNKDFNRPSQKALEEMQSKFGIIDTPPDFRGPYGVVDYFSGRKNQWGPSTLPLGFTKDMDSSLLGTIKDIVLTPMSYTIAGMNSSLHYGVVPVQKINIDNPPLWPSAEGDWGVRDLPISTYTSRILDLYDDFDIGIIGGGNPYYGFLDSSIHKRSMFQEPDGSYTTPTGTDFTRPGVAIEFPSFEDERGGQRTFKIPDAYPNNNLAFSIDSQFGWSHNNLFLETSGVPWGNIPSEWIETKTIRHEIPWTPEEIQRGWAISDEVGDMRENSFKEVYTTTQTVVHPIQPLHLNSVPNYNAPSWLELQFLINYADSNYIWPYKVLGFTGTHPLIRKDIGQRYEFGDGMDNWMSLQVMRAGEDVTRIEKWLETPEGSLWNQKQQFLQELNPREETRTFSLDNVKLSIPPLFHAPRHFDGETYMDVADFGPIFEGDPPQGGLSLRSMIEGKFPKLTGPLKTMDEGMDKITAGLDAVGSALGIIDFNKIGAGGRLRFLRDRFIALDGPADATLLGFNMTQGLNNTSPFGRTPKIPTQYVFSQKGAFGRGSIHENLGGGLGQSDAGVSLIHKYKSLSYGELGGKYVPHKSPLPSHGRKITADMPRLWEEASKAIEPTIRAFNKDLTEIDNLNKSVESYKKDLEKYGTINDQIGDPGMNVSSLGLVTDTTTDGSGLGVIKKNVGQTSKPGENYKSLATDKINMLPYGQDYKDPNDGSVNDFIKFKFYDVVNKKYIIFRAILSGISDSITPEWSGTRYIGRPDQVYVYQGVERQISFSFEVYPKTKQELPVLWEKLNYLVGLCYPSYHSNRMVAPFINLTLGDMFNQTPGFLNSLSIEVDDNTTWEIEDGLQLPKHISCQCAFTYIGNHRQEQMGKHYEL